MDKERIYLEKFQAPIVFWGMRTLLAAFVVNMLPPLYLSIKYNVFPPVGYIMAGFALIFSYSGPLWFVEPLAYFPILGVPGTYMAFLSGNISNMRLPCSALAQEAAGVEEGTQEGSILSTLGIGASILVNIAVLTAGVILGVELVERFPPIILEAFQYILPAIFGAVFGGFVIRDFKIGAIALVLAIGTIKADLFPVWVSTPLCVFGTIVIGVMLHNRKVARK